MDNYFGLSESQLNDLGSLIVESPLRVDLGTCSVVDGAFFEEHMLLVLDTKMKREPTSKHKKATSLGGSGLDLQVLNSVKQIARKVNLLKVLRHSSNHIGVQPLDKSYLAEKGVKTTLNLSYHPAVENEAGRKRKLNHQTSMLSRSMSRAASKEYPNVENQTAILGTASSAVLKSPESLQSLSGPSLVFDSLNQSAAAGRLESDVFKNYYNTIFGNPYSKFDLNLHQVKSPKDLMKIPRDRVPGEYLELMRKGKGNELLNFLCSEVTPTTAKPSKYARPTTLENLNEKKFGEYLGLVNSLGKHASEAHSRNSSIITNCEKMSEGINKIHDRYKTRVQKDRQKELKEAARNSSSCCSQSRSGAPGDQGSRDAMNCKVDNERKTVEVQARKESRFGARMGSLKKIVYLKSPEYKEEKKLAIEVTGVVS